MDPISELIQNNNIKDAKIKIKELEKELSEQTSSYSFVSLKNRIERLKEEFVNKNEKKTFIISNADKINIPDKIFNFENNNQKINIDKINNKNFKKINCIECKIEDCENINCEEINCKNSLIMMNVRNSEIHCLVGQLRLIDCKNIKLIIFTKTGIYLQNSNEIIISKLGNDLNNNYTKVYDFTCLSSNKNYKII